MPTRHRHVAPLLAGLLLLLSSAACSPTVSPATPGATTGTAAPTGASPRPITGTPEASGTPQASPAVGSGFAFTAEAVLGFYEREGFDCGLPQPSAAALGWTVHACERTDDAGRQLGIGLVTDPEGALGDGYARVTAADGADFLAPEDALDHHSGFLGAMLGDTRATALLPWLAGSMGNAYEETADGGLRVATYLKPGDDTRTIWLEVAGPRYLASPRP